MRCPDRRRRLAAFVLVHYNSITTALMETPMSSFPRWLAALSLLALLTACGRDAAAPAADTAPAPVPASTTDVTTAAPAAATPTPDAAAPADFDPASVPESTAALPPFPFFKAPEGLASVLDDKDKNITFDRMHVIAGNKVIAVEGKIFHDQFQLTADEGRNYSDIEFQRNYSDAIARLGGIKVSTSQYTPALWDAFGGRDAVDKHYIGACASEGCENTTYLIRQGGKEYWIQVSTGAIPLQGMVAVLEKQGMASALAFLSASDMKKAIDADGRVAVYINFDTDKAALRADSAPVIAEIDKLLKADPSLKVSIEGHTDNTGTPERNRVLSGERAEAVRAALILHNIANDRLTAKGFGADQPLADNGSEAGRAKNRRVELVKVN